MSLTYYDIELITVVKSFIVQARGQLLIEQRSIIQKFVLFWQFYGLTNYYEPTWLVCVCLCVWNACRVERMSVCVERMSVCVERTTLLPYLGCEGIYLKDRIKEK